MTLTGDSIERASGDGNFNDDDELWAGHVRRHAEFARNINALILQNMENEHDWRDSMSIHR